MSYTAINERTFRDKAGSLAKKICYELGLIDTAIDTASINLIDLTPSKGTDTALATAGVDLASGSDATYYAVFVAPVACTITGVVTALTEVYKKDTTDAKIEILDNAAQPVTKFTYTLVDGRAAKNMIVHTTIASAALAAGDILNLKITATGSSQGTGYAKVFLRYIIN